MSLKTDSFTAGAEEKQHMMRCPRESPVRSGAEQREWYLRYQETVSLW